MLSLQRRRSRWKTRRHRMSTSAFSGAERKITAHKFSLSPQFDTLKRFGKSDTIELLGTHNGHWKILCFMFVGALVVYIVCISLHVPVLDLYSIPFGFGTWKLAWMVLDLLTALGYFPEECHDLYRVHDFYWSCSRR